MSSCLNRRPGSRVHHWALSLIGIGCCVIASFLMSWVSTLVAWITCIILYLGLAKMEPRDKDRNWGSVSQALMFHQVRKYLLILDPRKSHVKYWRPQILLLISNPRKSCAIIEFTNALKKGGLFMLGHVKIGDLENIQDEDPIIGEIGNWYSLIDHLNIKAFVELTMCQTLRVGIQNLARLTGIGALKPHTVMLGLPLEDDENVRDDFASGNRASEQLNEVFPPSPKNAPMDATQFVTILEDLLKLKKNFLLFRNFQKLDYGDWFRSGTFRTLTRNNSIVYCDVWLVDFLGPMNDSTFEDTISEFILQMAFIVSKVKKWQKLTFRIIVRVSDAESEANKEVELRVKRKLAELRIKGIVLLMSMVPPTPSSEETPDFERIETIPDSYINFMQNKIVEQSANTAISFVYLRKPPIHESASGKKRFLQLLDILTKDMPPTLLIHGLYSVISKEL